eukprot:3040499-Pleurochrysis_carterae.AAC.1
MRDPRKELDRVKLSPQLTIGKTALPLLRSPKRPPRSPPQYLVVMVDMSRARALAMASTNKS